MNLQVTATIRQRGQLTIPDKIRDLFSWLKDNTVVTLETGPQDEVVIKPYAASEMRETDRWKKAWEGIQLARSFKGKRGNLSRFVVEDRERH